MGNTAERTYRYIINLSQKINGSGTSIPLEVSQRKKVSLKLADIEYDVTFTALGFFRKVYQPGIIEAELQFDSKSSATTDPVEVVNMLMYRLVKLSVVKTRMEGTVEKDDGNVVVIADNYFVYQVRPQYETQSDGKKALYVKLTIYSVDKLMTMSKYSKAYVAQKLGNILVTESKKFKYLDDTLLYTDTKSLQKLVYTFKEKRTEFIQPYLVQYNESFYDFIARVANRCGEFLFFDNGRLTLGLPETAVKTVTNYSRLTYQQQSASPFNVSDFTRDSVKDGLGQNGGSRLNGEFIEDREHSYPFPKDIFPQNLSYNAEVAPDEFFMPLFKGQFTSFTHEEFLDGVSAADVVANTGKHLFPIVEEVLRYNGTPADLVGAIAGAEIPAAISATMAVALGNENDTKFIDDVRTSTYGEEKSDGQQSVQFGGYDSSSWANMRYHADVKKFEVAQEEKMVCCDMGTNWADIHLGDRVRFSKDGQVYIVVQVKLSATEAWQGDYRDYNKADYNPEESLDAGFQSLVFYAIPTVDAEGKNAFPPVHPAGAFRQSGSQSAFVVANDDPKKQGRVRVIFPWQARNVQLQKNYDDAREKLELLNSKSNKLKTEISELNIQIDELEGITTRWLSIKSGLKKAWSVMPWADHYTYENADDRTAAYKKELQKQLDAKKAEIERLENQEANYLKLLKEKKAKKAELEASETSVISDIAKINVEIMQLETDHQTASQQLKELNDEKAQLELLISKCSSADALDQYIDEQKDEVDKKKKKLKEEKAALEDDIDAAEDEVKEAKKEFEEKGEELKEDRLSQATPWIRVTTPLATEGGGTMFKLEEGDEVMVNFEGNNVERPYVVGSVYSKNTVAPIYDFDRSAVPARNRNPSIILESKAGHAITFKEGSNFLDFMASFIPGMSIWLPIVAAKISAGTGFDWGRSLSGGIRIGDKYGLYSIDMNSGARNITIRSGMGDVIVDAFTGITIKAPNGNISIEGKNIDIKAYNRLSMTSGLNIQDKEILESDQGTGKAIGNFFKDTLGTAALQAGVNICGAGQIDLTFIRTLLEVFLKPVDGTMYLKSKRYMLLEAGSGEVQVDKDRYNDTKQASITLNQHVYDKMSTGISLISAEIDRYYDFIARMSTLAQKEAHWKLTQLAFFKDKFDVYAQIFNGRNEPYTSENLADKFKDNTLQAERDMALNEINDYIQTGSFTANFTTNATKARLRDLETGFGRTTFWDGVKSALQQFFDAMSKDFGKYKTGDEMIGAYAGVTDDDRNAQKQKEKRKAVARFLDKIKTLDDVKKVFNFGVRSDYMSFTDQNYAWTKFINSLDAQTNHGAVKGWLYEVVAKPFADMINKEKKEWTRLKNRDNVWNEAKGGQILFSDNSNRTYHIGEDSAHRNQPTLIAQTGTNYKKDLWGDLKKQMIGLK